MERVRIVGILLAVAGLASIVYPIASLLRFNESAGIGVIPIIPVFFGLLLLIAGICLAILGGKRTMR